MRSQCTAHVVLKLNQRREQWSSIKTTLERVVVAVLMDRLIKSKQTTFLLSEMYFCYYQEVTLQVDNNNSVDKLFQMQDLR